MSRGRACRAAAALALAAALAGPAAGTEPPLVAAVEVRADRPLGRRAELKPLLEVAVGEPLAAHAVRATLRNLHATGLVGRAEARIRREPEGARVLFLLHTKVRVAEVRIEGEAGIDRAELTARLEQRPGAALVESRVVRGVYRLQDLYAERGFLAAEVRAEVDVDARAGKASIVYRVRAGPQATVRTVLFEGLIEPFSEADLIERLRARPGEGFREDVARADAERLERWLREVGHRQASVERPRHHATADGSEVALVYLIRVGPSFEVEVLGSDVPALERKGALPLLSSELYDEALLHDTVERTRRYLQERGHYRARVVVDEEHGEEVVRLRLVIDPGPVFELAELELVGNRWVGTAELAALMTTSARRPLAGGGGRLVDATLEEDLENLRGFYALQGFREAEVGPPEVREQGGRLEVRIPIVEGRQQRVVNVVVEGHVSVEDERLWRVIRLRPGGPYHPRLLEDTVADLRSLYEELGFPYAQVDAALEWNEEETLADVRLRLFEGPRVRLDRVVLRGLVRTRPGLVRRVVGLRPGEVVNTRRLLEAQRRLLRLSVFSRAEVRLGPSAPFSDRRDVLVEVEEGPRRRLSYGLGWDSEDGIRGLLRFTRVNLLGRGTTGRLDLRASRNDRQALAFLQRPAVGRWGVPTTYSLFAIEEMRDTFDSTRQGLQIQADRYGRALDLRLLFTYKRVEVDEIDPLLRELEIDRELREVEVASLGPSLLLDRRDDPLDPERGWTAGVQAEYAFPLLSAETRFVKLFTQGTVYMSLEPWGVLAASLRVGGIEPIGGGGFDDPTLPPGLASRDVPISERFFAGGRTTHRAYSRDELGIPGETVLLDPDPARPEAAPRRVPVGGNGLALVNLDYRFPIAGPVGGTLFVDSGNVWADWRSIDAGEFKTGVGVGVRYLSPVGPLRLEVGWKLDREPGEDGAAIFLSFGNPF